MPRVAPVVPAETDLLCESCGYTLTGIPTTGNCPECGTPVAESLPDRRRPSPLERRERLGWARTMLAALLKPARFFRELTVDRTLTGRNTRADAFAFVMWGASSAMLTLAAILHLTWLIIPADPLEPWPAPTRLGAVLLVAPGIAFFWLTTLLAARLTTWEATYRGLRLPIGVVRRGMSYHAVHYLPVSVVALLTVYGFRYHAPPVVAGMSRETLYLYVLSGLVVVGAMYVFWTYWIAMRNLMYANPSLPPGVDVRAGLGPQASD